MQNHKTCKMLKKIRTFCKYFDTIYKYMVLLSDGKLDPQRKANLEI